MTVLQFVILEIENNFTSPYFNAIPIKLGLKKNLL